MTLSPNDVRNMKFPTTLSGYNKDQVDAFIESVAAALDQSRQDTMRMQMEAESLRAQLGGMKAFEDTIKNAAIDARRNADMTIAAAKQEGQMLIAKAKAEAEQALSGRAEKAKELESTITKLELIKKSYVAKLRSLITSHLEIVDELTVDADKQEAVKKQFAAQSQAQAKAPVKPVEKLEITGASEMNAERRENFATPPSKQEPVRFEEANAPVIPVAKAMTGDVSEMEALARALKANDTPRAPQQVDQPTDPELAEALARYSKTKVNEQPIEDQTMIGRTSVHVENSDTGPQRMNQEVNVDVPIFDSPAGNKIVKDPTMNLARELDEVVAKFEEELDKAQKS